MFGERRKHQRVSIKRVARIQTDSGATAECTVIDISGRGARLFVDHDNVPARFHLIISGDQVMRQECRLARRLGGELGVEFVSIEADQSRLNAIERIREDARKIFHAKNSTT